MAVRSCGSALYTSLSRQVSGLARQTCTTMSNDSCLPHIGVVQIWWHLVFPRDRITDDDIDITLLLGSGWTGNGIDNSLPRETEFHDTAAAGREDDEIPRYRCRRMKENNKDREAYRRQRGANPASFVAADHSSGVGNA
jgi:hypothetical protein